MNNLFTTNEAKLKRQATEAGNAFREALAEQPAQQEPVAIALNTGTKQGVKWLKNVEHGESLYTTPQPVQRKPQFKEFIKWAGEQGHDCGQTCNSDTGEWIVLNPMTADLWKAWQAAHGIKGD